MRQSKQEQLDDLFESLAGCTKCVMHETRSTIVRGDGCANAKIVLVGEAPGFEEDACSLPFQGQAGIRLNTELLPLAGLKREAVYITNTCKCRPTNVDGNNRKPKRSECTACRPFLLGEIAIIKPELIILLGASSLKTFLGSKATIKNHRGEIFEKDGLYFYSTYHPSPRANQYCAPLKNDFEKLRRHISELAI